MAKKKTTIEDLAVLIKRGFDQTATKTELREEIGGVKSELKELKEQIAQLAADISKLKEEVRRDDPFVEDLLRRMRIVEKRLGILK